MRWCGREKSPVAVFEFGVNPVASLAVVLLASSGELSLERVFWGSLSDFYFWPLWGP